MSVIMMLQSEHTNLRKLLDILGQQRTLLKDGEACQRDLARAIVEYWRDFPEKCHHPKEDLVLRALVRKGVRSAERLQAHMQAEHDTMTALTDSLARALDDHPEAATQTSLETALEQFVEHNRRHMALEEELLFKIAPQILDDEDMDLIEFDLLDRPDPVFDAAAEARYHIVLDAILSMHDDLQNESHDKQARDHLYYGDTAWLGALSGVEKFNELVGTGAFGRHVRLVAKPGSGYVIERDGTSVAAIPECPEQQAAWCAYCYLVGAERG